MAGNNKQEIIEKTRKYVEETLSGEGSGHDWWHVYRVWKTAQTIGEMEKADMFVVELAALLHDIADWKFNDGDEDAGARAARVWLESLEVESQIVDRVCEIIRTSSFKGAGVKSEMKTLEGKVLQDADRLDAIGAIGIGRTFAYGGHKGREMYNPNIKPEFHTTAEQYKNNVTPTINHFYEKLLLLKDLMNTKAAKQLAQERHKYMEGFLDRFYKEWDGKK
ncbi:MAG: HD domain-containing protein [Patescibacteria group bacterium]